MDTASNSPSTEIIGPTFVIHMVAAGGDQTFLFTISPDVIGHNPPSNVCKSGHNPPSNVCVRGHSPPPMFVEMDTVPLQCLSRWTQSHSNVCEGGHNPTPVFVKEDTIFPPMWTQSPSNVCEGGHNSSSNVCKGGHNPPPMFVKVDTTPLQCMKTQSYSNVCKGGHNLPVSVCKGGHNPTPMFVKVDTISLSIWTQSHSNVCNGGHNPTPMFVKEDTISLSMFVKEDTIPLQCLWTQSPSNVCKDGHNLPVNVCKGGHNPTPMFVKEDTFPPPMWTQSPSNVCEGGHNSSSNVCLGKHNPPSNVCEGGHNSSSNVCLGEHNPPPMFVKEDTIPLQFLFRWAQSPSNVSLGISCPFKEGDSGNLFKEGDSKRQVPVDYRMLDDRFQVKCLTESMAKRIGGLKPTDKPPIEFEEDVLKIFASMACWNSSFLDEEGHFGSSKTNHGVDMPMVRKCFEDLGNTTHSGFVQKILHSLKSGLIPSLPRAPPDVEALRVYLQLPFFHLFEQPKYFRELISPLGAAILELDKVPASVIDMWWGNLSPPFFQHTISIIRVFLSFIEQE
ncbi:HERC3-like protein [Mya arenaria]|uniref:HERC3-like protein n=1 Tax=Mya arenaria TaxID=6604 RepID=A0ABY7DJA9_MYAAR|nr:HERC3-like protein [Mya arenaria]